MYKQIWFNDPNTFAERIEHLNVDTVYDGKLRRYRNNGRYSDTTSYFVIDDSDEDNIVVHMLNQKPPRPSKLSWSGTKLTATLRSKQKLVNFLEQMDVDDEEITTLNQVKVRYLKELTDISPTDDPHVEENVKKIVREPGEATFTPGDERLPDELSLTVTNRGSRSNYDYRLEADMSEIIEARDEHIQELLEDYEIVEATVTID